MQIEIHRPELESMILQRLASGRFENVEDVLLDALQSTAAKPTGDGAPAQTFGERLIEAFAMIRVDGKDLDLSRDVSEGRIMDLS